MHLSSGGEVEKPWDLHLFHFDIASVATRLSSRFLLDRICLDELMYIVLHYL